MLRATNRQQIHEFIFGWLFPFKTVTSPHFRPATATYGAQTFKISNQVSDLQYAEF